MATETAIVRGVPVHKSKTANLSALVVIARSTSAARDAAKTRRTANAAPPPTPELDPRALEAAARALEKDGACVPLNWKMPDAAAYERFSKACVSAYLAALPPAPAEVTVLLHDAAAALRTLNARYGYEDDHKTPKDWTEWVEARRVRDAIDNRIKGVKP